MDMFKERIMACASGNIMIIIETDRVCVFSGEMKEFFVGTKADILL